MIQASRAATGPRADRCPAANGTSGAMARSDNRSASPRTELPVVIRAWGSPAANVWPRMGLVVDGRIAES